MIFGFTRAEWWTATPGELLLLADAHVEANRDPSERPKRRGPDAGPLLAGMFKAAAKQGAS